MIKLLLTCTAKDYSALKTCLEGLKAHSDVQFKEFEEVFIAAFPTHESLETLTHLLESIPFTDESLVRIVKAEEPPYLYFTLSTFHKAVTVDGIFRGKF